jgi:hypothetical protein
MKTNKLYYFLVFLSFAFSGYSCSDDNDGPEDISMGEANFTVSGAVEGEKSGQADFHHLTDLPGGLENWEISIHDFSPQTFSLQFSLSSSNSITQPGTGTYEIGFEANSSNVFLAIYTHIPNGDFMNSTEYSTLWGGAGTLTITTSNEDTVSGSFQFSATEVDDELNVVGTINITGEFTAKKRQF